VSGRRNVLVIVTMCVLVLVGAFAVLEVTDWNGGSYVAPFIGPVVILGGTLWFTWTRSLSDVDGRPTVLLASQEIVVRGLSESEAMDLAIRAMLEVPGARLVQRRPEMSWGRFSGTLKSMGEFCVVTVVDVSPTRLRISSRPALNVVVLDWGKNRQNVTRVLAAIQRLHPDIDIATTR
jgi:hypothetical protein